MTYAPPEIRELGTLADLTQNLLPSLRAAGGTMAALSAPVTTNVTNITNVTNVPSQSAPAPVAGGGDSGTGPAGDTAPGGASGTSPSSGGDGTSPGDGGGGAGPTGGGGEGGRAPLETASGDGGGELPFTGLVAGAVGAAGAALTGAGLALRRAVRRR